MSEEYLQVSELQQEENHLTTQRSTTVPTTKKPGLPCLTEIGLMRQFVVAKAEEPMVKLEQIHQEDLDYTLFRDQLGSCDTQNWKYNRAKCNVI